MFKLPQHTPTLVATGALFASLAAPATGLAASSQVEAETLGNSPSSSGTSFADTNASGDRGRLIWSNGSLTATIRSPLQKVILKVRGDQCSGAPQLSVTVDGVVRSKQYASSKSWTWLGVDLPSRLAAGTHKITVAFINDYRNSSCDRNLRVDFLKFEEGDDPAPPVSVAPAPAPAPEPIPAPAPAPEPIPAPAPAPEPIPAPAPEPAPAARPTKLFVDDKSVAARYAESIRDTDPWTAGQVDKIASQPQATWIGGYSGDDWSIDNTLGGAETTGTLPVITVYGIVHRDGGQYSAGGLPTADSYRAWIDHVATKIGSRHIILILEPDAVSMTMPDNLVSERWSLLTYAAQKLSALPNAKVYMDGGNSAWKSASSQASRLQSAGVAYADGFTLNAANFHTTDSQIAYGRAISSALGGKHFVVDTSRNGNGSPVGVTGEDAWCNPSGRALGQKPTLATGEPDVDAYLWIKRPGESDGTCNGGPKSGDFYPSYALGLIKNAGW